GSEATATTRERLTILWTFARPYLHVLAAGLLLSLVVSAMGLASPMVTKWVLDTLDAGGSLRDPVLLLLVLLVVGAGVGWVQWVMLGRLAEDIVRDARSRMILRYLGSRVFALLGRSPGELVTRVTSDTVLLNQAASTAVIGRINNAIMVVGTLVLLAVLAPARRLGAGRGSPGPPPCPGLRAYPGRGLDHLRGSPGTRGDPGARARRLPRQRRRHHRLHPGRLPAVRVGPDRPADGDHPEPHDPAIRSRRRRAHPPGRVPAGRVRGGRHRRGGLRTGCVRAGRCQGRTRGAHPRWRRRSGPTRGRRGPGRPSGRGPRGQRGLPARPAPSGRRCR